MFWAHVKENIISVFPMTGEFYGDYRCPIDRGELYKDLFKNSFDVPDNFSDTVKKIRNTKLCKKLAEMFEVKITWGIFLGLG